jgi:hypothetical protein
MEAAAQMAKAEAEEARRTAEIAAGKRKTVLRLPRPVAGLGRGVAATIP